jgi:hypothetical protein
LDRDDVIEQLAKPLIDAGHPVNLTNPEISVVVEVVKGVAGFCVIQNGQYSQFRKFNLPEVYVKGREIANASKTSKNVEQPAKDSEAVASASEGEDPETLSKVAAEDSSVSEATVAESA